MIELFAVFGVFLSPMTAQPPASGRPALQVTAHRVIRKLPDFVEINYALKNNGNVDLYFPYIQVPGATYITGLSVLHLTEDGAWVSLGPNFDVPSYEPKILHPSEVLRLTLLRSDPVEVALKGTGDSLVQRSIALRGRNRIRVEYYSGAAEWKRRLAVMKEQQESQRTLKPAPSKVAYSEDFEIPAPEK